MLRKLLSQSIIETLQPALNRLEYPPYIKNVHITSVTPGPSPTKISNMKRIASRSLSDIQLCFDVYQSGSSIDLLITVQLPVPLRPEIQVPISVYDINFKTSIWSSFLIEPSCDSIIRPYAWALTSVPEQLKFSVRIAKILPASIIPSLSTLFTKLLTNELPQQFLLPNATKIIMKPNNENEIDMQMENNMIVENLFGILDIENKKGLSKIEVADGLIEWGFASSPDKGSIISVLDVITERSNNDELVYVKDLVNGWESLQSIFIPRRYRGILTCRVLQAQELKKPFLGNSKPYIILSLNGEETKSDVCNSVFEDDNHSEKRCAMWDERLKLFVQQTKSSYMTMTVQVLESNKWTFYAGNVKRPALPSKFTDAEAESKPTFNVGNDVDSIIGMGSIALSDYDMSSSPQNVWVELAGGRGSVNLELQFQQFVDPRFPLHSQ